MKIKIRFILIFFVLITNISFSQTSDTFSKKKILLGITFSPDYCYRMLHPTPEAHWIADYRDSIEIPKFGFTTGMLILYEPSNHFLFETGLYYSNKGEKTIIQTLSPEQSGDPALLTNQIRFIYSYNYIDIPMKINYFIIKGRTKIFISAGLSTNLYLYRRTKVIFEGSDVTNTSVSWGELTRLNVSVLIGGGADIRISQKLNFRVEPLYKQSIISIVDAPIKQYQYSFGVNFGLYFRLEN